MDVDGVVVGAPRAGDGRAAQAEAGPVPARFVTTRSHNSRAAARCPAHGGSVGPAGHHAPSPGLPGRRRRRPDPGAPGARLPLRTPRRPGASAVTLGGRRRAVNAGPPPPCGRRCGRPGDEAAWTCGAGWGRRCGRRGTSRVAGGALTCATVVHRLWTRRNPGVSAPVPCLGYGRDARARRRPPCPRTSTSGAAGGACARSRPTARTGAPSCSSRRASPRRRSRVGARMLARLSAQDRRRRPGRRRPRRPGRRAVAPLPGRAGAAGQRELGGEPEHPLGVVHAGRPARSG